MSKVAVIYWSGTGNTEIMAEKVATGAKEAGHEVDIFTAGEFSAAKADEYEILAMGCPSMGAEILEEAEFQPMYDEVREKLSGKKVALFGSYDWGDGEWMENWEEDAKAQGAAIVCPCLIINNTPDDEGEAQCIEMGKSLK